MTGLDAFTAAGFVLPIAAAAADDEIGVLVDANDAAIATVDANGELPDEVTRAITDAIAFAINALAAPSASPADRLDKLAQAAIDDGRPAPEFLASIIGMGLQCWLEDRAADGGGAMKAHCTALRRFGSIAPAGARVSLPPGHPALAGQSLFQARVYDQADLPRLLVSGHNSRKIGKRVTKGRWRGMPIYTLTLEERRTCPATCGEWATCYGNNMHLARRISAGPAFEARLWDELAAHQRAHPGGFVVRLHVLGDFYSVDYAEIWAEALETFPALRVFGYTAHDPNSAIGEIVAGLIGLHPDRFAYRFSGHDGPTLGSVVVARAAETPHLICPAQTGATECCATCALCWHSTRTIAFVRH